MSRKTPSKTPLIAREIEGYAKRNAFVLKGRLVSQERKQMGRPSVMTQDVVRKLEYAFVYDSTVEEACLYAGISRDTYYNFCKKFPDFSDRIEQLRNATTFVLRKRVVLGAMEDANLAFKYLERKLPQEFGLHSYVHHSGDISDRHTVDPETIALIKRTMGNSLIKKQKDAQNELEESPSLFESK